MQQNTKMTHCLFTAILIFTILLITSTLFVNSSPITITPAQQADENRKTNPTIAALTLRDFIQKRSEETLIYSFDKRDNGMTFEFKRSGNPIDWETEEKYCEEERLWC
ncbi:hypothetical protein G9A89_008549 [Geosiphon pyriformis]|nr:hypothetical protein G9A89_008549 [Geosiphon pyriformis]